MAVYVVREEKPYRLICDENAHFAVLEARAGHVYPIEWNRRHRRRGLPDTPRGMAKVARGHWEDPDSARRHFRAMVENEERYAQILW